MIIPRALYFVATCLLLLSFFLVSCSGLKFGDSTGPATSTPTAAPVGVAQLHWCGKPVLIFRDEGAPPTATATTGATPTATATASAAPTPGKPTTLTNWAEVEPNLGFIVYLPRTLPRNTCLVSASGTIHDPIFGGSFTIGYLLPDHSSISLAEAPLRSQNREFQCSPTSDTGSPKGGTPTASPGPNTVQVCSGVRDNTSIVLSAHGSTDYLQQFFNALEPHIKWVPVS